jgi:hypothetical protein
MKEVYIYLLVCKEKKNDREKWDLGLYCKEDL